METKPLIPFYESYDWRKLPKIVVLLNSQLCFAYQNKADWYVSNGQQHLGGLIEGLPYTFKLTHGFGNGNVDRHYLYFDYHGVQYFVHTGESWPDEIILSTNVNHM